jgi:hypothetical protein
VLRTWEIQLANVDNLAPLTNLPKDVVNLTSKLKAILTLFCRIAAYSPYSLGRKHWLSGKMGETGSNASCTRSD